MTDKVAAWMRALRVEQWTKNGVVMLAWFFSVADSSQREIVRGWESFLMAFAMAGAFSLVSSAFYLLNDVSDYEADRLHPVKRNRPVAAGVISRITAVRTLAYTVMQCLYTGFLKRVPYIDVATLAAGFVLRAIAGAAIIAAYISPWLLVCTFTLSLFLALCKRKSEMEVAAESREVLRRYHPTMLKTLIVASAIASFAEYLAYTLRSAMGQRFPLLWTTSVLVLLGLARYLALAWRKGDVGRPERILLTDRPLWIIIASYGAAAVLAVLIGLD